MGHSGVARSKNVRWTTGRASKGGSGGTDPSGVQGPWPTPYTSHQKKLTGSTSIPGTPSDKSGVDMSPPVDPVRCPCWGMDSLYSSTVLPWATKHGLQRGLILAVPRLALFRGEKVKGQVYRLRGEKCQKQLWCVRSLSVRV